MRAIDFQFLLLVTNFSKFSALDIREYEVDGQKIRAFKIESQFKFSIAKEQCEELSAVLPGMFYLNF